VKREGRDKGGLLNKRIIIARLRYEECLSHQGAIPMIVNIDLFVPYILPDRNCVCIIHYMPCHIYIYASSLLVAISSHDPDFAFSL
jgi:hypothetical protein